MRFTQELFPLTFLRNGTPASKHRSPHRVRVDVRVRVGWSASGATAKILLHRSICGYIPGTRYLKYISDLFVFSGDIDPKA